MLARSYTLALCGSLLLASPAWTQQAPPAPTAAGQPAVPSGGSLTSTELEELLGPIALYPDDLLANVLAASVYPDEVAQAAEFAKGARDAKVLESKDWEPAVKAITKVPDVAKMMGEYPDWVTALGQAYLTQSQDVMATVQSLRKKAQATGALKTTQQQKVVSEGDTIYIQPANPEVIYVPSYEPSVVYVDDDDDEWVAGAIGFGAGLFVGAMWCDLACDWGHGCIGWGDVDVDIDRNVDIGNINIGNEIGSGNRVDHRNRVGKEGGAWSPNRGKSLATSKPSQLSGRSGAGTPGAASRASTPTRSSAGRAPPSRPSAQPGGRTTDASRTGARTSSTPRTQAPSSGSRPTASRTPQAPSTQRAQSAFQGGSGTRATSQRGSSSRQSASRSYGGGGRSAPSRGGGGGRGGGGRR